MCEIECTVVSGLEPIVEDEVKNKLGLEVFETSRGRVNFFIPFGRLTEVSKLKGVENFHVVIKRFKDFGFTLEETECLTLLRKIVEDIDWSYGIKVWEEFFGETSKDASSLLNEAKGFSKFIPRYRVTCKRTGTHAFQSPQAAYHFGGAINDFKGWVVDLSNFQVEVLLMIEEKDIRVEIALTKESLHRRNLSHFGPTTLKPTISHGLLWHAGIQPGDVVCDPMCGTSSIAIECSIRVCKRYIKSLHSQLNPCFNFSGDISKKLLKKSMLNWQIFMEKSGRPNEGSALDFMKWDATRLPLRDECVDVVVTDLPFGKRIGSKLNNWTLYKGMLNECARVVRRQTGRVCLLTQDRKCIIRNMELASRYFKRSTTVAINIGGLTAGIYVLHRNSNMFDRNLQCDRDNNNNNKASKNKNNKNIRKGRDERAKNDNISSENIKDV